MRHYIDLGLEQPYFIDSDEMPPEGVCLQCGNPEDPDCCNGRQLLQDMEEGDA